MHADLSSTKATKASLGQNAKNLPSSGSGPLLEEAC